MITKATFCFAIKVLWWSLMPHVGFCSIGVTAKQLFFFFLPDPGASFNKNNLVAPLTKQITNDSQMIVACKLQKHLHVLKHVTVSERKWSHVENWPQEGQFDDKSDAAQQFYNYLRIFCKSGRLARLSLQSRGNQQN